MEEVGVSLFENVLHVLFPLCIFASEQEEAWVPYVRWYTSLIRERGRLIGDEMVDDCP